MINVLLLVLSFAMLIKGAAWFVDGAAGVARKFGIPQLVIGLTIVAMGTSAPEAAVSITAALRNNAEICIGNIVGSNILNILIILGITAVITRLHVQNSTIWYEIPFMIVVTGALAIMGMTGQYICFTEGIILWVLFLIYLGYIWHISKITGESLESDEIEDKPIWLLVLMAVIGCGIVVWGSDIAVDAATGLAEMVGISDRVIGLTIVALGTSLPELVTSVTAAVKHNADIAIGNIVGSNIFNILFVIGTTALITPVPFMPGFMIDTNIAIFTGVLLWCGVVGKKSLGRITGIVMLLSYVVYSVYLMAG